MKNLILYIFVTLSFCSCDTDEWLSEKSQKNFVIPESLIDYQAIMDNQNWTHNVFSNEGLVITNDFYIDDTGFNAESELTRNLYSWNDEIWVDGISYYWNDSFSVIFKSNAVINGLKSNENQFIAEKDEYNNVLGQAYFYRAIVYYNLAQIFCKTYDAQQAISDLGLPLRESSDVNIIYERSNLEDTYQFIVRDIEKAISLLPVQSKHNRRPNKVAAVALLAKVSLIMEKYEDAFKYSRESLNLNSKLLDFNSSYINLNSTYRFQSNGYNHPEILFFARSQRQPMIQPSNRTRGFVSEELYQEYKENDLRERVFFIASGANHKYRGAYTGALASFCGIANNEIFLILAESAARIGQDGIAINTLNHLLSHRYVTNNGTSTYIPYTDIKGEELLRLVLQERRKELVGVGNIRFEDVKRLNKDPRFQIIIRRVINSVEYVLTPNDNKYVFPIPDQEIQSSGLQQNPR